MWKYCKNMVNILPLILIIVMVHEVKTMWYCFYLQVAFVTSVMQAQQEMDTWKEQFSIARVSSINRRLILNKWTLCSTDKHIFLYNDHCNIGFLGEFSSFKGACKVFMLVSASSWPYNWVQSCLYSIILLKFNSSS